MVAAGSGASRRDPRRRARAAAALAPGDGPAVHSDRPTELSAGARSVTRAHRLPAGAHSGPAAAQAGLRLHRRLDARHAHRRGLSGGARRAGRRDAGPRRHGSRVLVSELQELPHRQRRAPEGHVHLLPRPQHDRPAVPADGAVPVVAGRGRAGRRTGAQRRHRVAHAGAVVPRPQRRQPGLQRRPGQRLGRAAALRLADAPVDARRTGAAQPGSTR